ncbi:hypothetical protein GW17_00039160 [Ensete ventricosum]|nr:hypothetical protein GW17_00039160 [Ensete ventricosum]
MQSPTRVSRRGISNVKKTEENSKSQQADKERDIIPERLGVLSLCGGACDEMDDAGTKASGWIAEPVSFLFLHNILNWMIMMLEKLSLYFPFSTCVSLLLDELPPKCKTSRHGDQGISLSSEDMEVVMDSVGLSRNHEGEHLKEETASDDISSLFEEREPSLDEVKAAFHIFDENNDGYIDAGELQRVLLKLGFTEGLELDACMSMITIYDENHDGKIGFTDVTLVCSDPCKLACSLAQGQRQAVSLRSYMAHAESASTNSIPPVCFILCLDDPLVSLILFAVWKQQKQKQRDGDVRMVNVVRRSSSSSKPFVGPRLHRSVPCFAIASLSFLTCSHHHSEAADTTLCASVEPKEWQHMNAEAVAHGFVLFVVHFQKDCVGVGFSQLTYLREGIDFYTFGCGLGGNRVVSVEVCVPLDAGLCSLHTQESRNPR